MKELTELELREIKGGLAVPSSDVVENKNTVVGCRCIYNNTPSVINTNTVGIGCSCICGVKNTIEVELNTMNIAMQQANVAINTMNVTQQTNGAIEASFMLK